MGKSKYSIKIERGTFGNDEGIMFRASITDGINGVGFFNIEAVQVGFGTTEKKATDDFIRRNISNVLGMVFENE